MKKVSWSIGDRFALIAEGISLNLNVIEMTLTPTIQTSADEADFRRKIEFRNVCDVRKFKKNEGTYYFLQNYLFNIAFF